MTKNGRSGSSNIALTSPLESSRILLPRHSAATTLEQGFENHSIPGEQTNMSEGKLAVAEIHEREAVRHIVKKRRMRSPFLAGAIVLVALAAIGIGWWAPK